MKTNLKITKDTNDVLEFEIEAIDMSIPNAIRRCLSNIEIKSLNAEDAKIDINTTIHHNENVRHIISNIPLNNNSKELNDIENFTIDCEYNDKKRYEYSDYHKIMKIMSNDINYKNKKDKIIPSEIQLFTLKPEQKLKISEMKIVSGNYIKNAQFQAAIVEYKMANTEKYIEGASNGEVKVYFKIKPLIVDENIAFPLYPKTALIKSIECIIEKIETVEKNIDNYQIDIVSDLEYSTIIINNEDHTIGYLLQCCILRMPEFKNKYCGYRVPHPLDNKIEIKMTHSEPKKILLKALKELKKIYDDLALMIKN